MTFVRDVIDCGPMGRFQIAVVAMCVALNVVDGFDVLAMAFTAPGVAREWGLTGSQVGVLLSAGLIGMALGSALLAPLADRIGRRPLSLGCLATAVLGMLWSAASTGLVGLGLSRLLTGIGIGGLIASLPVLLAEVTPARRRATVIALYGVGLPLGGVVGGMVAGIFVSTAGWRATFLFGAALTAVMLIVASLILPESVDSLLARRPARALDRINGQLRRMGFAPVPALPELTTSARPRIRTAILGGGNGARTALLWLAFSASFAGYYFAASWTPNLVERSGGSAAQGIGAGVMLGIGGIIGLLALSLLAVSMGIRALTILAFGGAALGFLAMAMVLAGAGAGSATVLVAIVAIGLFVNASGVALFALAPDLYPVDVRATAIGWAAAAGRVGGIVSPLLAGLLVDLAWRPSVLFALYGLPMVAGAVAVLGISRFGPKQPRPRLRRLRGGTSAAQPGEVIP